MSIVANQKRTFLNLVATLQPHWHQDAALPARIQRLLARNRAIGSRDRRLYRELLFTTLRHLAAIEPLLGHNTDEAVRRIAWWAADTPATHGFRAELATGDAPADDARELLPSWFQAHCPELFSPAELEAQRHRPPMWLRLQTADRAAVVAEFDRRGWRHRASDVLPQALALLDDVDVTSTDAWQHGAIEVQDLGSQLLLETIGVAPGERWLDGCAGAGGKTLQLAALLGRNGAIDAYDIRPAALAELRVRAARAGIQVLNPADDPPPTSPGAATSATDGSAGLASIRILSAPATGTYDGVLVDAPCSGSGTWRRAPHLKWITSDAQISQAADRQRALLHDLSARVKPGGRLVYATCSLSRRENEETVAHFLAQHPEFAVVPFARTFGFSARGNALTLLPSRLDTDGFFVASLRRR